LHQGPGKTERATGQQSGKGAGQTGVEHDGAVGALTGAGERIDNNGRGQGFAPTSRLSAIARINSSNKTGTAMARTAEEENDIATSMI
jgi:hypothetical protein